MLPVLCTLVYALPAKADLSTRFAQIALAAKGRVGAGVLLLESGESAYFNASQRFPMQSVYKVPIAMAVLQKVDQGKLKLHRPIAVTAADIMPSPGHSPLRENHPHGGFNMTVRDLIHDALVESDGTASDVLLRLAGGPKAVTGYLRQLGVREIDVATTEREMTAGPFVQYRNGATPRGAISLLRALQQGEGLSAASRALIFQRMRETTVGPRRIKGLLPPGTPVAHKTGADRTVNGFSRATNDIGIVTLPGGRHLLVAVFVSDSRATTESRESVIAKITRAAWDRWSGAHRAAGRPHRPALCPRS